MKQQLRKSCGRAETSCAAPTWFDAKDAEIHVTETLRHNYHLYPTLTEALFRTRNPTVNWDRVKELLSEGYYGGGYSVKALNALYTHVVASFNKPLAEKMIGRKIDWKLVEGNK